ncbi:MAG: hypothetical protein KDK39_12360 [Leptospiraceae bacterium]|nr:hypothetical protein [Leptospiraceae bacterium]
MSGWKLLPFALLVFTACDAALLGTKSDTFQRIDLTQARWIVSRITPPARTVSGPQFPIILNDLFANEPGTVPIAYHLSTSFELGATVPEQHLILSLAYIGENWSVALNGSELRREIYLDENGQLSRRRTLQKVRIALPKLLLRPGENRLTIQILGYPPPLTWIGNKNPGFLHTKGYYIDTDNNIRDLVNEDLFSLMAVAVYFFFGLYHVILFLARRHGRHNLYFGFFAALIALYLLTLLPSFQLILPFQDSIVVMYCEYGSLFMIPAAFILFLVHFFHSAAQSALPVRVIVIWSIVCSAAAVLLPDVPAWYRAVLVMWQASMPLMIIYCLLIVVQQLRARNRDALPMLFGLLSLVLIAIFDISQAIMNFTDVRLLQFGFFLFVMYLVFRIARHMAHVENQLEAVATDLRQLNDAFYRFVPTQVLQELGIPNAADLQIGDSVARRMSVLFSDIRSFTSISESMSSDQTFSFLNSYLKRMEPQIQHYNGYVDKFMGDGIMALYSDSPKSNMSASERALRSALQMQSELEIYNRHRHNFNYPPIKTGTGIHTGDLSLGTIGSLNRIETTVIGNTVNVASRLEELTSYFKVAIIVSSDTFRDLQNPDQWQYRELGSILPRGKTEGITIYEFFDMDSPAIIECKLASRQDLASGIAFYRAGEFEAALEHFSQALKIYNADRVARLYYKLTQSYRTRTLSDNWMGTIEIVRK